MTSTNFLHLLQDTGIKARYDTEVKKILSSKTILSRILKFTVKEFKDCTLQEIQECIEGEPLISEVSVRPSHSPECITSMSNEDREINEGAITYDIVFHVFTPTSQRAKIIINIEAQNNYYPGYDLVTRGIFYGSRMISSQLDKEFTTDNYNDIKKVYSIWICVDTPKYAHHTITEYKIVPEKLWGDFSGKARYDLLSVIMICLGDSNSDRNELIEILNTVLSEKLNVEEKENILTEYGIQLRTDNDGGVNLMCNLSDRIEQIGIQKGIERGIKQGIEQGIERGIEQGTLRTLFGLYQDNLISLQEAARRASLTVEEFKDATLTFIIN